MAWISILGMYNYDNTIFDDLVLPEGIDRETLIDTILFNNAELGLVYADGDVLKRMIKTWSRREYRSWYRLNETVTKDYDFLSSKDITKTEKKNLTTTDDGSSITTNEVSGFNSNTLNTDDKSTNVSGNVGSANEDNIYREFGYTGDHIIQEIIEKEREIDTFNIYDYISNSFKNNFCLMVY